MPSTGTVLRSSESFYEVCIAGMYRICLRVIEGISDHCVTAFPKLLKHGRWTVGSHGSIYDFAGKVIRAKIFRS